MLAASDDGSITSWDAGTGRPTGSPAMQCPGSSLAQVTVGPDGRALLTLHHEAQISKPFEVRVWDIAKGTVSLGPLPLPVDGTRFGVVTGLAIWSPDGRYIAAAAGRDMYLDRTPYPVGIWDARTGAAVMPIIRSDSSPVLDLAFSPDGRTLAIARGAIRQEILPGEVRLIDVTTGHPPIEPIATTQACRSVAFSPDGRRLLTACGVAFASEGEAGLLLGRRHGPAAPAALDPPGIVESAAFRADGRFALACCEDGLVGLWDVETGSEAVIPVSRGTAPWARLESPDGRWLLTRSDGLQLSVPPRRPTPDAAPLGRNGCSRAMARPSTATASPWDAGMAELCSTGWTRTPGPSTTFTARRGARGRPD